MNAEHLLASWAGLEQTQAAYPAEVTKAIAGADRMRHGFTRPSDPTVEPSGSGHMAPKPVETSL